MDLHNYPVQKEIWINSTPLWIPEYCTITLKYQSKAANVHEKVVSLLAPKFHTRISTIKQEDDLDSCAVTWTKLKNYIYTSNLSTLLIFSSKGPSENSKFPFYYKKLNLIQHR